MKRTSAFLAILVPFLVSSASAYNPVQHKEFVSAAADEICARDASSPACAELKEYLPFVLFGAEHEDTAAKGHDTVFNYVRFKDEEGRKQYGPCKEYVVAGKTYMYCNHYFFLGNFLSGKGGEGACGVSIAGATSPLCSGDSPFSWESARQRGTRLMAEKAGPYYSGNKPDSKARAYYWLGRVAHLLGDMSVPGHLLPHKIGTLEFEHRSFEYEAARTETGPLPGVGLPADVSGLFVGLASDTLAVHDAVRSAECRRNARVPGCEKGRATPARPLESFIGLKNLKLTNDLMKGDPEAVSRPEIVAERELARLQLLRVKPLTVRYIARLLELFAAQTGLAPVDMPGPAADTDAMEGRTVAFDGF